jgi:glycosyltransferase involved in cell wall biosynthesis
MSNNKDVGPSQIRLPTVTTIIANYNYSHYVLDAVRSAIAQDYPCHQICIVDDCSTDDSYSVVEKFIGETTELKDAGEHKVKVCIGNKQNIPLYLLGLTKNSGPSFARNSAIQTTWANSHLFHILDADDIAKPDKVSKSVAKMMEGGEIIGGVYTDNERLNVSTGVVTREYREYFDRERLFQHNMVCSSILISKLAIEQAGLYDSALRLAEDLDLHIRVSEKFLLVHIPEPLITMRSHEKDTTNSQDMSKWQAAWQFIANKHRDKNV